LLFWFCKFKSFGNAKVRIVNLGVGRRPDNFTLVIYWTEPARASAFAVVCESAPKVPTVGSAGLFNLGGGYLMESRSISFEMEI